MPVNEESVIIPSAGLNLSGVVALPDGVGRQERRAAFLVLHGFGSNKESERALHDLAVPFGKKRIVRMPRPG
jgi:hypothetical protein